MQCILNQQDIVVKAFRKTAGDTLSEFNAQYVLVDMRNSKVRITFLATPVQTEFYQSNGPKGQEALSKLATAMKENQDVNVLEEGRTDNVPIAKGTAGMRYK